jgi:cytoskeletal protein CcmA (bactofilin family)
MISQHLFTSDQISGKILLIDEISTDNLNIANDLDVGGSISCTGSLGLGISHPNYKLHVIGDTNIEGDLTVIGESNFNGDVNISGALAVEEEAIFDGDVTANENVTIKKDLAVSGNSTFNGDVTANENVTINKDLTVNGDSIFEGDVTANENVTINKDLTVNGDSIFEGDVTANENVTIEGDTIFNGNVEFEGDDPLIVKNGILEILEAVSAPTLVQNKLYNLNGSLFWSGVDILNSSDTIAELEDTNISSQGNGELLIYNDTLDKWVNANLIAGTNVSLQFSSSNSNITISSSDIDVSLANLKNKLSSNLGTLTIGDSNDVVKINGSLEVIGTTTTNNVEVVSTSNGVVFEGSAIDNFEGTLKAGTLNADRTYILPNKDGTIAMTGDIPTNVNQLVNDAGYLTSHPNISAASSSNNSGRTYVQDITLDSNGHVTSIATATETVVDTNFDTTYSAGTHLNLDSTTFSVKRDLRGAGTNPSEGVYAIGQNTQSYFIIHGILGGISADTYLGGTHVSRLKANGDLHVDGDVVAFSTAASDEKLKDNINTIDNALYKVNKLRGVEFEWNTTSRKGEKDIGVVAQEVAEVLPEIVREKTPCVGEFCENTEKYKTVDYQKLTAVLIEAVKELSAEVEDLKKKLS